LLVNELKLLVGVIELILLHQPDLFLCIESFTVITLDLYSRSGDIGHCLKLVFTEDFTHGLIFSVVDNSEENWSVRLRCRLVVGVRRSSKFSINFIALHAARFDCENGHDIVRSGVLNDHLVVLLRS
jgi:hypothetical protein